MKKMLIALFTLILLINFPIFTQRADNTQEEKTTRLLETVKVVNVEVPVRVFRNRKPIDNLTKNDFLLYENGKPQPINGFFIKKKKIKPSTDTPVSRSQPSKTGRYFVLIFDVSDYNNRLKEGIQYLFEEILEEQDEVLTFINDKSVSFRPLGNKNQALEKLKPLIKDQCQKKSMLMLQYHNEIIRRIQYVRQEREVYPVGVHIPIDFLRNYLNLWERYRKKYLVPELDTFFNFARHLKKIKKEKWVLNFYQVELFPKLDRDGPLRKEFVEFANALEMGIGGPSVDSSIWGREIHTLLDKIDRSFDYVDNFPLDELNKLFYKANTTFHSILIPTSKKSISGNLKIERVATDIENLLPVLSKSTGGMLLTSTEIKESLRKIQEKEDVYYLLTYAPTQKQGMGKIKIKVKNGKYKVMYDDNIRADYINEYLEKREALIPSVKVTNLLFKNRKLSLQVENFLTLKKGAKAKGAVTIQIIITNERGKKLFDQSRTVTSDKKLFDISIQFNWLKKGKYDILINVKDLLTEKSDTSIIQAARV
jgi:hypothetical protein